MKKIISMILATAMILSINCTSFAITPDVKDGLQLVDHNHTVTFSKGSGSAVLSQTSAEMTGRGTIKFTPWDVTAKESTITVGETTIKVTSTDETYYPKALHPEGMQNGADSTEFYIDTDKSFVISYGIKGEIVDYTINCVVNGNVQQSVEKKGYKDQDNYVAVPELEGYEYIGETAPSIDLSGEGPWVIDLEYKILDKTNHIINTETVVVPGTTRPSTGDDSGSTGTEIPDEPVPQGPNSGENNQGTEIDDENVPLAPGANDDNSFTKYVPYGTGILCALLLMFLMLKKKKDNEEVEN